MDDRGEQRKWWNICAARTYGPAGDSCTKWVTVGRAFQTARGIKVKLDALPLNFDGDLMLFEGDGEAKERGTRAGGAVPPPDDGSIPF